MLTSPIVITLTGLVGATFAKTYETQAPLGAVPQQHYDHAACIPRVSLIRL